MNRFGNNMLVIRAEIYPGKLPALYVSLRSIDLQISQHALPDVSNLEEDTEYPIALTVTSLADDTVDRVSLPNVPG